MADRAMKGLTHTARLEGLAPVLLAVLAGGACTPPALPAGHEDPNGPITWQPGAWTVIWQDEFDGAAGTPPDPSRWNHEVGGWGWGNKELQYYTDSADNAALDGQGNLLITARAQPFMGKAYTSARLTTKGLFAQTFGRFEARLRLVTGRGLWPAFWIMGDDIDEVGWPRAGEIDVMEQRGHVLEKIFGTVHGPSVAYVDVPQGHEGPVPGGVNEDFHVYAVEWDPASIVFLVDEVPYFQLTPRRRPTYAPWVYDHPFFMILNLAVGGLFSGNPDATTMLPQSLAADYVRVSVRQATGGAPAAAPVVDELDAGASDARQ